MDENYTETSLALAEAQTHSSNSTAFLPPDLSNESDEQLDAALKSDFFGCYCLVSKSIKPNYKGRTYIGFTVNPNRRIRQHNGGRFKGGAKKTDNRGPWDMVMIVHGFPNAKSALRFEWAWQNPEYSRRLKELKLKKVPRTESFFQFRFRILSHMLRTAPWKNLKLVIRWLLPEYKIGFPVSLRPGPYMQIVDGPVSEQMTQQSTSRVYIPNKNTWLCKLCKKQILMSTELTTCPKQFCPGIFHLICLADYFRGGFKCMITKCPDHIVPVEGSCPECKERFHWFDIVKHKRKLNSALKID